MQFLESVSSSTVVDLNFFVVRIFNTSICVKKCTLRSAITGFFEFRSCQVRRAKKRSRKNESCCVAVFLENGNLHEFALGSDLLGTSIP